MIRKNSIELLMDKMKMSQMLYLKDIGKTKQENLNNLSQYIVPQLRFNIALSFYCCALGWP